MSAGRPPLDVDGAAAPPLRNGELAFDEPWQSRLFGLTMALCESGAIDWDRFRDRLIAGMREWETAHPDGAEPGNTAAEYAYWDHWQAALTHVVAAGGLVSPTRVEDLAAELAARPAGHDHGQPHHPSPERDG